MNTISPNQHYKYDEVRERILTEERIMKSTIAMLSSKVCTAVLAVVALFTIATAVNADAFLQAQSFDKQLPNGTTVPMWGFASCDDATFTNCSINVNAPGPQIDAFAGSSLTINVKNNLPTPVSIVIPGQVASGIPTTMTDASGRERVKSFTHEIAVGAIGSYNWSSLKSGTYLYQSGTHPSLQVPMGLYGALVVHENASQSYTGVSTTSDSVLLFSEIDPVQNQRVANAVITNPDPTVQCISLDMYKQFVTQGYPCTVDYNPIYFFTNGVSKADILQAKGETTLLRLINAGLRSHTPSIIGLELGLIAEDGNLYPGLPRKQSAVLLAAGKTLDAVVTIPNIDVTFSLIDYMPTFVNESQPDGGALGSVQVGAGSPVFVPVQSLAMDDAYNVVEDTTLTVAAAAGVLSNDTGLTTASVVSGPSNGSILLNADGSFTYTPNENFSGADGFTYSADGNTAQVLLSVSFVNDIPIANSDGPYVNTIGTDINISAPGILANDQDVDGDNLTAVLDGPAPAGLTLNADGSFVYTGSVSTSFTYTAFDGTSNSAPVTVKLTSNPVAGIALTVIDSLETEVTNYRWTVEEDTMWKPEPGVPVPTSQTLAVNFHKSHMPVVAQGIGAAEFSQLALDPTKHYFVSVLPADAAKGIGHTIGGARIIPNINAVTVRVNNTPLPTAQISIFVFEDNSPTNGAVDGNEKGLGGFQITLEDAGGRYGASGGQMSQDALGNPLKNSLDCFGDATPPEGIIVSCPDTQANRDKGIVGEVLIKNLYQAKYGIIATSPFGDTNKWIQTSTIEGTKVIDAWVKAGEPAYFQEFGPAGWHVFIGFVNPERLAATNPGGTNTVTGKITNLHMSRPPIQTLYDSGSYDALAHTKAWVGINSVGGTGPNYAAVQAADDGSFSINGIPDGTYQLVVWDSYLDQVIGYRSLILPNGGNVGNIPIFQWFTRTEHNVFLDENQNGKRDEGEGPIPEQAVNLRWRDGTINQSFPTDSEGFVPFDETFPFFHWQVQEVDFARFKATGLTTTVDAGGDVSTTGGVLNPQVQADGETTRTEKGPVLTQGFQGFLGQTSIFDWGKAPYKPGENGGISGIVYYASTRAENDPRLAVGEEWEPGVPSATVRLYREIKRVDDTTARVLVAETKTDSWDESLPSGCPGSHPDDALITGGAADKCYDGLRNFNQARPAVFDGGYAFMDIPPGKYIVEVVPPLGFSLVTEESNNVGFGDSYDVAPVTVTLPGGAAIVVPDAAMIAEAQAPEPGLAQPSCVGDVRPVGDYLTLFPDELIEAPFAQSLRPLCDKKEVILADQGQAAADFFLYTAAPIAGHFVGMILDDVAQEFNPLSPQYGEKWAPPFVPVSVRDHQGKEISRVYSDQWGRMNGLVPSTFTANMPSPSGYAPAMHMTCMNDPGPIPDPSNPGKMIIDPQYNPAYSNFCYTFQYMPGTTTYLDTPVLPVSSFASGYNPPDCALDDTTPMIKQVDGTDYGPLVAPNGTLTIYSEGVKAVPNPAYTGPTGTEPKTINRNFDFGTSAGTNGSVTINGTSLTVTSWGADKIVATAPATSMEGELIVTRANGKSTEHAVTVTVSNEIPIRVPTQYSTIQEAIDNANVNQLVMVAPGSYNEFVIMWKPVRLQGAGASSTIINAVKRPTEAMVAWRAKMDCLFGLGQNVSGTPCTQVVNGLPNQPAGGAGFDTEEGAAVTVIGPNSASAVNTFLNQQSRIDGFSITGGDTGGGIFVNSYAHGLEIANNHVFGNSGSYHGGIRIGRPYLELEGDGPYGFNKQVSIHHNSITQNGGLAGAGGGLSIASGSDRYSVTENFICGNFAKGDGGGIGHLGLSDRGEINNNRIVLNQSFDQANTRSGGGVFIGGEPPIVELPIGGGLPVVTLTKGSGSVTLDGNLIQSNHAGAGHGGGIRTQFVNGVDIVNSIGRRGVPRISQWHLIDMTNNIITNNVAGWSGGGISLQDTALSRVLNNTISNNDATSTVGPVVNVNISQAMPAGISSEPHSPGLNAAIPVITSTGRYRNFSNPDLQTNIIWKNRSFHYDATTGTSQLVPVVTQTAVGDCGTGAQYWDLGVLGTNSPYRLSPLRSILTDTTGYDSSNLSGDPSFVNSFCNGGRDMPGSMFPLPALDEGGAAWIDVRFGPLKVMGDYHIGSTSAGLDNGGSARVNHDFDNNPRPLGLGVDRGADEFAP